MLKTGFYTTKPANNSALVVLIANKAGKAVIESNASDFDKKVKMALSSAIKASANFTGKARQSLILTGIAGAEVDHIVLLGVGNAKECSLTDIEAFGSVVVRTLKMHKISQASILLDSFDGHSNQSFAAHMAYGAVLEDYSFDQYKTKSKSKGKDKVEIKKLDFILSEVAEAKKLFTPLQKIAEGVFLTRDLVTEPANVLYPESFAARAKKELTPMGVKVQILTDKHMEKLGMGSLLSVGQGSARPSRMVIMQYDGLPKTASAKQKQPIAFVGKGVTFDTGGISLKPAAGMDKMKWDMGGAGTVTGLIKALAGRKAKVNVIGVIALAENMPSSTATRPGDVVTSMSGQTIEVLNTDAEGRLVLADALWHTQEKFKPKVVIDLATLTGAIIVALGHEYAGIFSNDEELPKQIAEAGEAVDEKAWHMPMCKAWDKAIDSPIADIQNIGGASTGAGSATAAAFLQRFIKKGTAWAHIDIAGMAWADKDRPTVPKGGTGYGVRLLDTLVKTHYEGK